ncbi:MAG: transposase [Candidatus Binatia bacterium]
MKYSPYTLTNEAKFFLEPASPAQRQYEALRTYFVEEASTEEVSRRFGYTPGSFRVLCHHFRREKPDFFRELKRGPRSQPKKGAVRELIISMRKQNLSIYDIERSLKSKGSPLSCTAIWEILREEGFSRLPRRGDEERPERARPEAAEVADQREFVLNPRRFETQLGGLFLFLPFLARCEFPELVRKAGYPGSRMIPATQALLSLLALKLCSRERKNHVMDLVFDEGIALFAGLNVVPKTTYLSTYSDSISPTMNAKFRAAWVGALKKEKFLGGESFNLDFHAIPFFGADEFVERHYLSKRSRSQKSILVFLAQEADSQVICYSCADLLKRDQADQVIRFVEFWKGSYGRLPSELVFDSKLTTYKNLNRLNQMGIMFMTLRRRSPKLLREIANARRSAWRTIHLDVPHRMYQTPKVIDRTIGLRDYKGTLRQLFITDLGHEEPTILLTNDLKSSAAKRITRYAQRMLIENSLAESVDFFHLDALSSAVRIKVDFDVILTEIASGLYRMLARLLPGFEAARARQVFRHFLDTPARVEIGEYQVEVTLPKRAHNPLLIAAGFGEKTTTVPWW